ncbi:flagellar type III secretion system pore protein FliP [Geoalkalibacter halelectricus]|uniref:Flagellar biosynthetic protein FliP n=1 Tax=Geoalkalibacter halelectricus TaxID=2847045 RepID=A0ABY5ZGQ9_9BACT|nr:flagellar type III secretion system pore protein FliP [Geoalkalibacter halelectricus]MDO3378064.1 flagellar type III secretion system pore protein FliP [Geoalkalibacter halelectricus]UWZ78362.1 flagellar type III secretion system pore protein FliP [Geoalkalibacter halelectricus]
MKALLAALAALILLPGAAAAQMPTLTFGIGEASGPQEVATALQVLFVFTVLSVAPAILLMTTSFTRIVIVLGFVRNAMGTQQAPPNQVIIGLALFLTFFIMAPVFGEINERALQPYMAEEIAFTEAVEEALIPMRDFMLGQTSEKDLALMIDISGRPAPANVDELSTLTLIPAFMLSELKRAFQIGFLIYIPFLVIDMVVASVLMGMGMMMLPPIIISLPFKLLLFVLVDGWELVVTSLVRSFG